MVSLGEDSWEQKVLFKNYIGSHVSKFFEHIIFH